MPQRDNTRVSRFYATSWGKVGSHYFRLLSGNDGCKVEFRTCEVGLKQGILDNVVSSCTVHGTPIIGAVVFENTGRSVGWAGVVIFAGVTPH